MYELGVVLFDLDGVLVNTVSLLKQAYRDVARDLGIKPPDREALSKAAQIGPQRALKELFGEADDEPKVAFDRYWRASIKRVSCFAGIAELLRVLSSFEIILGTVTSRNSADALSLLDAAGIRSYMRTIVTWGHYRVPKPSPACLLVALQKTGRQPSETAYVGDQPADMLAAKSAGIIAIGAIWDVNADEDALRRAGADVIARKPKDILPLVFKT
jgi:HAD superfamily hydrolase (TIGR01509 family)